MPLPLASSLAMFLLALAALGSSGWWF